MNDQQPELGRFAEPSLYILISLSEGPKHGYAIMTDIERVAGSPMGPGTLYGALDPVERRRPYRLTALGAMTLEDQLRRLRSFIDTGLARLRGRAT